MLNVKELMANKIWSRLESKGTPFGSNFETPVMFPTYQSVDMLMSEPDWWIKVRGDKYVPRAMVLGLLAKKPESVKWTWSNWTSFTSEAMDAIKNRSHVYPKSVWPKQQFQFWDRSYAEEFLTYVDQSAISSNPRKSKISFYIRQEMEYAELSWIYAVFVEKFVHAFA